ncbi:Putative flippase GtrA (transmembrane translocase of bactoprenol-linked glucose) [Caloramator quimbayensis]|uniref:Putative flippase GtrA (Transmembrane translocase of bactoprenol-linked glucose) n=1 Tax=Caloramator quimbayensis TaxID=1147123 RepID=A0A1T4Y053_9CLOT|nr:GtrA family protein [Caloramator quimbayensis]SKA95179.1 Putative flippase GtrA (transmembrane translocase of bactoprenol-linked glucose) [Caloramator quimbayensis]
MIEAIKSKISFFEKYKKIFRFSLVGVINTLVDFAFFSILNGFTINKMLCQFAGYSMGTVNSFIMNKLWTFEDRKKFKIKAQIIKFAVVNIVSLLISMFFINFFYSILGINVYVSKVLVTLITQLINFAGYRYWVFI